MNRRRKPVADKPAAEEEHGLSLEELGQAYAAALSGGAIPYSEPHGEPSPDDLAIFSELEPEPAPKADEHCELTPVSILEAILFVGRPDNEPITSADVARLMRGVRPIEVDELVVELNQSYERDQAPYIIASLGAGYRMELRPEYDRLCRQVFGKVREVRLSQAAIDCLAIIAYKQPVPREEVDRMRGRSSGGPLALLVRRGLVRLDRNQPAGKRPVYRTTQRFLEVFRLERLDDLPQAQAIEADL
jgi:segregation and condensation protein B